MINRDEVIVRSRRNAGQQSQTWTYHTDPEDRSSALTLCCILWFYNSGESAGAQGDGDQAHPHAAAGVRYIPMTVLLRGEVQSDGTSASSQKEKQKASKCKLRLQ